MSRRKALQVLGILYPITDGDSFSILGSEHCPNSTAIYHHRSRIYETASQMFNRHEKTFGRALSGGSISFGGEALGWIGRDMEFLNPEILRCEPGRTPQWFSTRPIYVPLLRPPSIACFLLQLRYRDMSRSRRKVEDLDYRFIYGEHSPKD